MLCFRRPGHISSFGAEAAISKQLSTAVIDVVALNGDRIPVTVYI